MVNPINLYNAMGYSLAVQWLNEGFTLKEGSTVLGHSNLRSTIADMPNKPLKNSAVARRRGLIGKGDYHAWQLSVTSFQRNEP